MPTLKGKVQKAPPLHEEQQLMAAVCVCVCLTIITKEVMNVRGSGDIGKADVGKVRGRNDLITIFI